MNFRMSPKTFFILLGIILFSLYLGYEPISAPEIRHFPNPDPSRECLGYYYKEGYYRYKSEYKQPISTPIKSSGKEDPFKEFNLRRDGNFTREQVKAIKEYLIRDYPNPREIDEYDLIEAYDYLRD